MIESGSCGGAIVSTKSECDAAATALDLSNKTAIDRTNYPPGKYSNYPPGCVFTSYGYKDNYVSILYENLYVFAGGGSTSCSSSRQCICMFTPPSSPSPLPSPPSPPLPPPPPPMPPGTVQIAGGYYMIESGSCGGGLILTVSECEAAATALALSDKTADDFSWFAPSSSPPGCIFSSGSLWFFGGSKDFSCSYSQQCICKSTPP